MKISTYKILMAVLITFISFHLNAQVAFKNANQLLDNPNFYSGCPVAVVDWNKDGLDDIIRLDQTHLLYVQIQKPGHQFQTLYLGDFGPNPIPNGHFGWSIAVADIDKNGYMDIVAGGPINNGAVKIFMTNSTGTGGNFISIPNSNYFLQNATFGDFNNDGWIDLFCCDDNAESHLYLNDGTGTLAVSTLINFNVSTSDDSGNYGSVYTDFDNDGDLDLYIAKCRQGVNDTNDARRIDVLFENNGNGTYTENAATYNLNNKWQSWTASFGDIDNDGDLDLMVTNHDHVSQIMQNDGTGHFTDITTQTGFDISGITPIESVMEDFDNDGFIDILTTGSDSRLSHNNGNGTFTNINGLFDNNQMESFALGDLNHDGFIDVYGSYASIYTTPSTSVNDVIWLGEKNSNHFITLDLRGVNSNSGAIGARASIYGAWGVQIREVKAGESYGTNNTAMLHFGLGATTQIDSLVIRWPAGTLQTIINPVADQFMTIIENDCVSPVASITTTINPLVICTGQTVNLSAPSGYTYLWSDGSTAQNLIATAEGEFIVTISTAGNNCIGISPSIYIYQSPNQTPTIAANGVTEFCIGNSVQLVGPPNQLSYLWSNGDTTQTIVATQNGLYTLMIQGYCQQFTSTPIQLIVHTAAPPIANDTTLIGPGIASLNATGSNVSWFTSATGGNPIASGNTFTTPLLTSNTTYYLQDSVTYGGNKSAVGMLSPFGISPYSGNTVNASMYFDVLQTCTIENVKVFTDVAGPRTILLIKNGVILDSLTVNVTQLVPDSQIVTLNFNILPGTNYELTTDTITNKLLPGLGGTIGPRLKRNSTGVVYPYSSANVVNITTSSAGGNYFYYFYDWKFKLPDHYCESTRNSVTVTIQSGVGIQELSEKGFGVYPNPAHNKLNIQLSDPSNSQFSLFDQTGRLVVHEQIKSKESSTDISNLAQGMYNLQVQSSKGVFTQKVIVQ